MAAHWVRRCVSHSSFEVKVRTLPVREKKAVYNTLRSTDSLAVAQEILVTIELYVTNRQFTLATVLDSNLAIPRDCHTEIWRSIHPLSWTKHP